MFCGLGQSAKFTAQAALQSLKKKKKKKVMHRCVDKSEITIKYVRTRVGSVRHVFKCLKTVRLRSSFEAE